jgi:hypothetical protein
VIEFMAGRLGSERAAVVGLADALEAGRWAYPTAGRRRFGVLLEQYSGAVRSADDAPQGPE